MRQFITIATNAFMELVRQPVFLLLATGSCLFEIFLATPFYFAFGDEPKLVKNSVLAVTLLAGLFSAVLSASASLAREIRSGTALAVLSKPIGRAQFVLAKYFGIISALTLVTYINTVASLVAGRMTFDAYGEVDLAALGIFVGSVVAAYLLGGFSNFFLRRPFTSDAVLALTVTVTVAAVIIFAFTEQKQSLGTVGNVDWRMVPLAVLILFALWILAAIALACSTRLDVIPTLAICSAGRRTRARGGGRFFTPSCLTGKTSGSLTRWIRGAARSIGDTWARPLSMRPATSAPRWPLRWCCLKTGN
jgi:ABC-type transport system involved in cytochrome c biogenesis permease component